MTTTPATPSARVPAKARAKPRNPAQETPTPETPTRETPTRETATRETATRETALPFSGLPIGHGAVLRAIQKNTMRVELPMVGEVRLPPGDTLAWLGGLAALAVVGVLDWPVAAVIGVGHVLAHQNHLRLLKDFGEGLEQL
jgi:hypothetical protein